MPDIKASIGQQIKAARKAKGWTQKQLAEIIGVGEPTIAKYESGRKNMTLDTLHKISIALGTEFNVSPEVE